MVSIDAKDLIDKIRIDEVIDILYDLGSDYPKESEEYLIFQSVCHQSESWKLYFYKESKRFYCYSNCHQMSLFDVIMKAKECSFLESLKFVNNYMGNKLRVKHGFGRNTYKKISFENIEYVELEPIKKQYLYKLYSDEVKRWQNEGISIAALDKFNIKYDTENNKIIIPHFRADGKCVGIRCRFFNPIEVEKGKYRPLWRDNVGYAHSLGSNLYGLNISKENIKKYKKCVVFEGEKSVLLYETYYPNNNISVAICGSNFTSIQQKMLLDLGIEEICLCLDRQYVECGDNESIEWKNKIHKMLRNLKDYIKCSYVWDKDLLGYKDSPVDRGKEIFERLLKDRIIYREELNEI